MKKKKQPFQLDVKTELHDVESSAAECLVPDQGVTDAILAEIDEAISKNKKVSKKKISKWPKLPLEFKDKWVAALRSGKYKKCKEQLVKTTGNENYAYCVLGVAAKISGYDNNLIQETDLTSIPSSFMYVPKILRDMDESGTTNDICDKLIEMNDGNEHTGRKGYSFNRIADWIEKNL